jgi:hypothetical protein
MLMVLATGIEPVFSAPATIKSLEGFLGYASITFVETSTVYFPMMVRAKTH